MTTLTRDLLEDAFTELGRRALGEGKTIDLAVYGGSALILATNFRAATADVDAVAQLDQATVDRLAGDIARERNWSADWLNDGVRTFLSPNVASVEAHHHLFRAYPDEANQGLRVFVPSVEYMTALKLAALRKDPVRGEKDRDDIKNLLAICNITTADAAMDFVAKFFPEYERTSRLYPRFHAQFTSFFQQGIEPPIQPIYNPGSSAEASMVSPGSRKDAP